MKGICHEYEIGRTPRKIADFISVARYEITIVDSILTELTARRFQHIAVNVYRDNMASRPGDMQGKPPVARAEIDRFRAADKSDCIQHGGGIRPERLPPLSGGHLGGFKKAWKIAAHVDEARLSARRRSLRFACQD